jgi:predicted HAD superfamily Cof-like phosphohydrolase
MNCSTILNTESLAVLVLSIGYALLALAYIACIASKRKTMLGRVREFHKRFDCYTASDGVSLPPEDVMELRRSLIAEEFWELMDAMGRDDLVDVADAIVDLHYVLSGTSLVYGLPEDAVFDEVHRSNMSKAEPDGTVHRRADGKILKAARWTPPDIAGVLARHGGSVITRKAVRS